MMEFSLLMAVYSGENPIWLDESLESIFNEQEITPNEVVLVIDGPITLELESVISKFVEKYPSIFNLHRLSENKGLGYALNEGLEKCSFDLVARMDADDIAYPNRFKKQLVFMNENPDVDILGGGAEIINEVGTSTGFRSVPTTHSKIIELMWSCPLIHPSVMYRKSTILNVGSYSKILKRRQDYDLWFRCAEYGANFVNLPEPLISYRITDNSYSKNSLSVSWQQAMIGFKGCKSLSLNSVAYLGVFYPVIKSLLPFRLRRVLDSLLSKLDPRENY